jgi:hypothetical protein
MIYSKRHALAWKPAASMDEALQRMLNPTPADEAHDRAVAKALGISLDFKMPVAYFMGMSEQDMDEIIELLNEFQ